MTAVSFTYRARDPLGRIHSGAVDASNLEEATQQLRRDGFHVLEIDEDSSDLAAVFAKRVTKNDIIYTTSQLAIMVETGITIAQALETIVEQETSPALRRVLLDLKQSVEAGEDFSKALSRHPKYFDETYVSLIRASEATGSLGDMLERIASYMAKEKETRGKVRAALAYPAAMLVLSISVTVFLLLYILPKFEPLFNQPGTKLPAMTVFLMKASEQISTYWYLWLAGIVAAIVAFIWARRTEPGRQFFDYAKINTPILAPMFRKVAIARSIRTLGTMISSGVPVLDALQLSADVSGNYFYKQLWLNVIDQVTSGKRICEALDNNPLVPPMLIRMVSSGEDTGKLDVVLERVSRHYDEEVDSAIKTATRLIEPIMITCMGVVVGGIAMSLLLPIFSLSKPA